VGGVRFTTREGPLIAVSSHVQLVEICQQIAEDDDEGSFSARPLVNRTISDGCLARWRGYPAITITCRNVLDYVPDHHRPTDTPGRVEQAALDRALGFCDELIERVDAQLGPEIQRAASLSGSD
jgi:hypothetical protein